MSRCEWHERKGGYIKAMQTIRRNALKPEPEPVPWYRLLFIALIRWSEAFGR